MDDKWMVDDRCHVFSAHFPSGNWSDLPDPPWSRTRPGPASSSSSSTATINMKSKLEVYDFQPRKHIYIYIIYFHRYITATSLDFPAKSCLLCQLFGSLQTLALHQLQVPLGKLVGADQADAPRSEDERLYEPRPGT